MAATRVEADTVIVVVDLDDGCPVDWSKHFSDRCAKISTHTRKPVECCFAVREYECWLLADLTHLQRTAKEYSWDVEVICENPSAVRGAKELLGRAMGRRYRETVDQLTLTKKIDPKRLFERDRSFRKLVKAVLNKDYTTLRASL